MHQIGYVNQAVHRTVIEKLFVFGFEIFIKICPVIEEREVIGVENIIDDNIATLNINETSCSLAKFMMSCLENRAVISGLGKQISIFPYHREYKIKYADKNRIIFSEEYPTLSEVSGEIDLNSKTLIYTVKNAGINRNETRKIEVITDNAKIQELEKKIISKYLRKRMFER